MNKELVKKYLETLDLKTFEIRDCKTGYSGYYEDSETAVAEIERYLAGADRSLYITLNEVSRDFIGDRLGKPIQRQATATADKDVSARRYMLIDFDRKKEFKNGNATPEQKAEALRIAKGVGAMLSDAWGLKARLATDSGNGIHLYYALEGGSVEGFEVRFLLGEIKLWIEENFPDACIEIDTAVGNASRIARIAGIDNCKTAERIPTKILKINPDSEPLDLKKITPLMEAKLAEAQAKKEARQEAKGEDLEKIKSALASIDPDLSHSDWISVLYALKAWDSIRGHDLAQAWSEQGASYDRQAQHQIDSVFKDETEPNKITVATLFHYAKENGWTWTEPQREPEPQRDLFGGVTIQTEKALPGMPAVFPPCMVEKAKEIRDQIGVPEYASLAGMLSILSACVCDKVEVKGAGVNWDEALVWDTVLVADSGQRKTALFDSLIQPIKEDIADKMQSYKARKLEYDIEATALKKMMTQGGNSKDILDAEKGLALKKPLHPNFIIQDVTPESFLDTLKNRTDARGISCVMLATDEGQQTFNALTGHYSNGKTNNSVFLKGHDGKDYSANRKTSGSIYLEKIFTPIFAFVQPEIISNAIQTHGDELEGQGVLPRLEFIPYTRSHVPFSELGKGKRDTSGYNNLIQKLLRIETKNLPNFQKVHSLDFSKNGLRQYGEYYDVIGTDAYSQGSPWKSKAVGRLLRLCALLHLANGNEIGNPIEVETVKNAWQVFKWFESMRGIYFSKADKATSRQIGWIEKILADGLKTFDLRTFSKKSSKYGQEAYVILDGLETGGYIARYEDSKGKIRWQINPALTGKGEPDPALIPKQLIETATVESKTVQVATVETESEQSATSATHEPDKPEPLDPLEGWTFDEQKTFWNCLDGEPLGIFEEVKTVDGTETDWLDSVPSLETEAEVKTVVTVKDGCGESILVPITSGT